MLVKDAMVKKVITVKTNDTLEDVLKKFSRYKISGVPVINGKGKIEGLVTESDILKTIDICLPKIRFDNETSFSLILELVKNPNADILKEGKHYKKIKVSEFMTTELVTIGPEEELLKAAQIMNKYHFNRIPVIHNEKLVGIIARADIIRAITNKK